MFSAPISYGQRWKGHLGVIDGHYLGIALYLGPWWLGKIRGDGVHYQKHHGDMNGAYMLLLHCKYSSQIHSSYREDMGDRCWYESLTEGISRVRFQVALSKRLNPEYKSLEESSCRRNPANPSYIVASEMYLISNSNWGYTSLESDPCLTQDLIDGI